MKALVVDDNDVNRLVAKKMLALFGFAIDVAENGQIAIEKYCSNQYQIILMDCQMPVMDGYEATRSIRKIENEKKSEEVPIVAVMAHANKTDQENCLKSGMSFYLTKPLILGDVENMILHFFPGIKASSVRVTK